LRKEIKARRTNDGLWRPSRAPGKSGLPNFKLDDAQPDAPRDSLEGHQAGAATLWGTLVDVGNQSRPPWAEELAEPESTPSSSPEMDAMSDYLFLPGKEELDKLLRYEAMINRQLNHAIAELERVQARRKGEASRPTHSVTTKQSQEAL
jgi:hypothetical protein